MSNEITQIFTKNTPQFCGIIISCPSMWNAPKNIRPYWLKINIPRIEVSFDKINLTVDLLTKFHFEKVACISRLISFCARYTLFPEFFRGYFFENPLCQQAHSETQKNCNNNFEDCPAIVMTKSHYSCPISNAENPYS